MSSSARWGSVGLLAMGLFVFVAWSITRIGDHPDEPAAGSKPTPASTEKPSQMVKPDEGSDRAVVDNEMMHAPQSSPQPTTVVPSEPTPLVHVTVSVLEHKTARPMAGAAVRAVATQEFGDAAAAQPAELVQETTTDSNGQAMLALPLPGQMAASAMFESLHGAGTLDAAEPGTYQMIIELQPSTSVRGVVLDDATGTAISGARVSGYVRDAMAASPIITGLDGEFELSPWPFDVVSGVSVSAEGYGYELVKLVVNSDGTWNVPARFGVAEVKGTGMALVEIRLVPEKVVTGRVVDASNAPVVGASVTAQGMFLVMANVGRRDEGHALTATDGAFRLAGLRSDIQHAVTIVGGGGGSVTRVARGRDVLVDLGEVRVGRVTSITGIVQDAGGRPAAGARITLLRPADSKIEPVLDPAEGQNTERDAWGGGLVVFEREVYTDDAGAFSLEGAPPGVARLIVEIAGRKKLQQNIDVIDGQTSLGVLAVKGEIAQLSGMVEGLGVSKANLEIAEPGGNVIARRQLSSDGAFRVSGLEVGQPYVARLLLQGGVRSGAAETRRFAFVNEGTSLRFQVERP